MKKGIIKNEIGQSSVEFIISFIMVIGFVFMYVKIALNFTNGYLVHYGNYVSSRAFMVFESNSNSPAGSNSGAANIAKEAWDSLGVDEMLGGVPVTRSINHTNAVGNNVFVGIIASFQDRFSIFSNIGPTEMLEFRTESFLGREPTIAECVERICSSFEVLGIDCNNNTTVMDNGC